MLARFGVLPLCAGLVLCSGAVSAETPVERYEVVTPNHIRGGGARATIHAPLDLAERAVMDVARWKEHIHKFEKVQVVGRHGERKDVYLQVPILKGAAKIWVVAGFEPPKRTNTGSVIQAHMLKGNMKRLDASFRLTRIDDQNTRLEMELLLEPDWPLPVPSSLVTSEAKNAAGKAVDGLKRGAEEQARLEAGK